VSVVCCQVEVSPRADHSSRGVLPSVYVCVSVILVMGGTGPLGAVVPLENRGRMYSFSP
jgi:hypothetical protein